MALRTCSGWLACNVSGGALVLTSRLVVRLEFVWLEDGRSVVSEI
jgi:hypothetical protein